MRIAFTGKMASGKTTAAKFLVDRESWNPASFLHQGTTDLFEDEPSFVTREYEGMRRVS